MSVFPVYKQRDAMDCGPTCLKMIASWYGKNYPLPYLREQCHISREGVSMLGISEGAETIGFRTIIAQLPYEKEAGGSDGLLDIPLPCIAYWYEKHFVVLYKVTPKHVWIADPAQGKIKLSRQEFENGWLKKGNEGGTGIILALESTPNFYRSKELELEESKSYISLIARYLTPYKGLLTYLIGTVLLLTVFQVIFPFLTQSIVDIGIQNKDIDFIYVILIAQLGLFIIHTLVKFIQSWILLQIGTRINVNLVTDFLSNLMKLPMGYFDSKMTGDLMQRIRDNDRVEDFLTRTSLSSLFSFLTLVIFSAILLLYNPLIFGVFFVGSAFYLIWVLIFLKKRKEIDYLAFQQSSKHQQSLFEIINGMQEIKLQGSEKKRRWQWLNIQALFFKIKTKSLLLNQYQESGANFINQAKDIIIIFIAARSVVEGSMTLGMMIAIQYIIGQLNTPLQQILALIQSVQDAKISLDRLYEMQDVEEEEQTEKIADPTVLYESDIEISNVSFSYSQIEGEVLKDIDLVIPNGSTTAIVGTSGSGKTTLLKLILGFYNPSKGKILIGSENLKNLNKRQWRKGCGTVMQDGFIFSDTIENNIAESDNSVNRTKLRKAVYTANIEAFIENLPLKFKTRIGSTGNGISQGQRQRLLIARAVYKNPSFLFFDEATNALDANNERVIMEKLSSFLQSKTVVVVAHRLSTVKHADQIVVLDKGRIIEVGNHETLVKKGGAYFTLIKNQLELAHN